MTPALGIRGAALPPVTTGAGFDPARLPMGAQSVSESWRGLRRELLE